MLFVLAAFVFLVGRLWYLQVLNGERYYRASTENIVRTIDLDPPRGRVFDREGAVLATNRTSYTVEIAPHILRNHDVDSTLSRLRRHLNLTAERVADLEEEVNREDRPIVVRRDIPRVQVAALETDKMRLPGVEVRVDSKRHYPLNSVFAHTVGFMGEVGDEEYDRLRKYGYNAGDFVGRMGLERAFEPILRGSPGRERQVVDASGIPQGEAEHKMFLGSRGRIAPIPGRDVVTTLDARLQLLVDEAMSAYPSGAAVAVEPETGEVLAMYSKPVFNPNSWSGKLSAHEKMRSDNDPFKPMLDKSVKPYFPGSIYKIVGAFGALDRGVFAPGEEKECPGYYGFGGRRFRCWKWGGHGDVDMREALQESCDVYFYKVASELGLDQIAEYAHRFGFGEPTGIPHNRESFGRVPTRQWHREHSPNGYQQGFALNSILGQGNVMVTPIQAAMAYAAIANGGRIYYPKIVREIRNGRGDVLFEFPSKVRKEIGIEDDDLEVIRDGLWRVVNEEDGTAYRTKIEGLDVSGKTGTAQVHSIGKVRIPNRDKTFRLRDHAWFASYAPSDDPEIALVVFLEHAGHGGRQAAPVATEILEEYFDGSDEGSIARKIERGRVHRRGER